MSHVWRGAGTEQGMAETFGSTCHGAGRAQSRNKSRNKLGYEQVLEALKTRGISIRVASPKLVMEEAPESYKVTAHLHRLWFERNTATYACFSTQNGRA